jgi:putative N-acetyltransferase (TIGR04045 family)
MIFDPVVPFRSADIAFKLALDAWELGEYFRLRRAIFCAEQAIFAGDDRDAHDAHALPIVAISALSGMPDRVVGTVRIYEEPRGTWYGGRLSVDSDYRHIHIIGPGLIRKAVTTACSLGCSRFLAYVQTCNVALFQRLRWQALSIVSMHGREHACMEADLGYYRTLLDPRVSALSQATAPAGGTCP